jgi:hypothetical protein
MKRRDLLLGSAAAVGAPSVAAAATHAEPKHDPVQMEARLARVDRRMAQFSALELIPRPPENPEEEELFTSRAKVGRAALRSLYFTGVFMELEEHERLHPGVQERMRRLQPEMDDAVLGMTALLESLTPADYRALQAELKKDPDAGLRIGERLQEVAAEDGLGFSRRVDLRLALDEFMRRLRAQNPGIVLDPYTKKVRRVQATQLTELERERMVQVQAGEQAFWQFHERSKKHLAAWDTIYAARPRVDLVNLEETYPGYEEHPEDPTIGGVRVQRVGGYLLGIGLGATALGGVFYLVSLGGASVSWFIAPAVVLGTTIGPALILGGLVVLLVGTIIYAAKAGQVHEEPETR